MARTSGAQTVFATVRSEGGLLPPDLLARIAANDPTLKELDPEEYGLGKGEKLNEAASRAWEHAKAYWAAFRAASDSLGPAERGLTETREQWLLPLFRELGYGRLAYRPSAEEVDGRRYAISHRAGDGQDLAAPPVHTVSFRDEIEKPGRRVEAGGELGLRVSPHGLLQEYLNRTDHLWGVVTNGKRLRLLRDNASLSRAAFVEFDLEAMLDGGVYADFVLFFLLLHRSRLAGPGQAPEACRLERWHEAAAEGEARALDELRRGVETAIRALGQGLLEHPANGALRERLVSGALSDQGYYRQLLRLVYRLLFLLAAEERGLLFEESADPRRRDVYRRHYGVGRLRALVEQRRHADRYDDLWRSLGIAFAALRGGEWSEDAAGAAALRLKPLAGGLFGTGSCPDLDGALVANARLLEAVRGLTYFTDRGDRLARRVNYRDMDVEELGSVYEGLLELQPVLTTAGERPSFALGGSGERKSTGSYYTNPGLVRELIASALEPVIADALARGRTAEEKRRHLLDLKVCDPACGSGHFLLAAARRIGREVARLDAGETEPDPTLTRNGVREAISHCVYGVDLNPLAVDLCKLALWLEGHTPGKPLGFLDHHVKQGNSLIGATRAVMEHGVPDDAFEPVTGDDRLYARGVKGRNRRERTGQAPLPLEVRIAVFEHPEEVHRYYAAMNAVEQTVRDVEAKGDAYDAHRFTPEMRERFLLANLWTAAFFWPLTADAPEPPTTGVWSALATSPRLLSYLAAGRQAHPHERDARTVWQAQDLATAHGFFHWELEFEEVFARANPGFDCVLGNPPWERIKLQEQEFFATRAPEIAGAINAAARQRLITLLTDGDPALAAEFVGAKHDAEAASKFLRGSGRFPRTGCGDVNTYAVFAELMTQLLQSLGSAGMIVPDSIATNATTAPFFSHLVDVGALQSLYGFVNERFLFPGIDHRVSFALLTVGGSAFRSPDMEFGWHSWTVEEMRRPERRVQLVADDFQLLNPNTRTCPIFRSTRDAEITKALYRAAPVLIREGDAEGNPWGVTFKTLFHMSNDSHLFRTRQDMERAGYALGADGRFRRGEEIWLPLYEAKMIHQFEHRYGTYECQSEAQANQGTLPSLSPDEHADPNYVTLPRYWVSESHVQRVAGSGGQFPHWFLGFRDITYGRNERTAIFSLLPWSAVGHTLPLITSTLDRAKHGLLLANFNSVVVDYACRQKISGNHLTYFILKQLPVLPPSAYFPELLAEIVPRVLELVYTAHDLAPFARDCGYDGPPFVWDEERRALLRAVLDGLYAHLYGLNRDDFAYILDTFPIVRRKDEAAHGEYRTKRLCLAAYDRFFWVSATSRSGAPRAVVAN